MAGGLEVITKTYSASSAGQRAKLEDKAKLMGMGWRVTDETVVQPNFSGSKACCYFIICFPLAFFAYKNNGETIVRYERAK